jgi:rhodanese-related sulfurtransferase
VVELYVEQTKKMSVNDLKKRLKQKDKALLVVDARVIEAFYNGHIPGAVSIFDGEILSMAKDMDKNLDIIAYGPGQAQVSKDPMDRLAGDAINRLNKLGFKNCMELEGGFEAWANAGNPVDTSKPESIKPVNMLNYEQLKQFLGGMGGM